MSKQDLMDYVMNTPCNTNPSILKQLIDSVGDSSDMAFLDLKKTITEVRDDTIVKLPWCAFCGCTNLKTVVLPKVENVAYQELFEDCPNLAVVDFTALTTLGGNRYDSSYSANFGIGHPLVRSVKALVNRGGLFQIGGTYCDYGMV